MRIVILANGIPPQEQELRAWLRDGDHLVCADGGARAALALGLVPLAVIGDFDSLAPAQRDALAAAGAQIIRHPRDKDETDLELALEWAAAGFPAQAEFVILGAHGGRTDQMLANMMLLALPALRGRRVCIASGSERIFLIHPGEEAALTGAAGDTVSLLPMGGDALGVTTSGLRYPLRDEALRFGPARGVSNALLDSRATVHVRHGVLLCVMGSEAGARA